MNKTLQPRQLLMSLCTKCRRKGIKQKLYFCTANIKAWSSVCEETWNFFPPLILFWLFCSNFSSEYFNINEKEDRRSSTKGPQYWRYTGGTLTTIKSITFYLKDEEVKRKPTVLSEAYRVASVSSRVRNMTILPSCVRHRIIKQLEILSLSFIC